MKNFWDCFFIIPNNNSNYFLYKSSDGKIPSEKLKDYINQITNNNYVIKINKNIENEKNELSEIEAIENTKIIMEQIQNNKNNFINNFENFKNFFKEKKKIQLDKKKNEFPEDFIKGCYDDLKKRHNNSRISLGLFEYYYLNEDKQIEIEFLDKIYEILKNYDQINNEEKKILEKEYNDLKQDYLKKKYEGEDDEDNEDDEETEDYKSNGNKENSFYDNDDKNLLNNKTDNEIENKNKKKENKENNKNDNIIEDKNKNKNEDEQKENGINEEKNENNKEKKKDKENEMENGGQIINKKEKQIEINDDKKQNIKEYEYKSIEEKPLKTTQGNIREKEFENKKENIKCFNFIGKICGFFSKKTKKGKK